MIESDDGIVLRAMTAADLPGVIALWQAAPGVELNRRSDSPEALERFLACNEGLSQVAVAGSRLAGCVLCGCDGRRGLLYHMAVDDAFRRRGLGRRLAEAALDQLRRREVANCVLFVLNDNHAARGFWESCGFELRDDFVTMLKRL